MAGGTKARAAMAISVAALLMQGCGTRVASEDSGASSSSAGAQTLSSDAVSNQGAQAGPGAELPSRRPPPDVASTSPVGSRSSPALTNGAHGATNPRRSTDRPESTNSEAQEGPFDASSSPAGQSPIPSGPSAAPPAGPRSPILLASVGTYSGPVGAILEPVLKGAQLWVKAANAKGGVNGHRIDLLVYDDGGDPARHRAQVQDAVEHQGVIGFFVNAEAVTGAATVDYLETKRVPVVGMSLGEFWAYSSPMYFPQASAAEELVRTFPLSVAHQVLARGQTRLGTLICVEVDACNTSDRIISDTATKAGMDHVYRGRASLAQPDFTAECLSARNENVEVFAIGLDQNSINRVATACARQGFHPTYATNIIVDQQKDNSDFAGAVGGTVVFPWFQAGTPATDEFRSAVRNYGGGLVLGAGNAMGWTAGKLLERAAAGISEPPTTESLLAGLWTIKGDTLGGLTSPLTFVKDKPPPRLACWFNLTVAQRAWISPDAFTMNCLDHGQ